MIQLNGRGGRRLFFPIPPGVHKLPPHRNQYQEGGGKGPRHPISPSVLTSSPKHVPNRDRHSYRLRFANGTPPLSRGNGVRLYRYCFHPHLLLSPGCLSHFPAPSPSAAETHIGSFMFALTYTMKGIDDHLPSSCITASGTRFALVPPPHHPRMQRKLFGDSSRPSSPPFISPLPPYVGNAIFKHCVACTLHYSVHRYAIDGISSVIFPPSYMLKRFTNVPIAPPSSPTSHAFHALSRTEHSCFDLLLIS